MTGVLQRIRDLIEAGDLDTGMTVTDEVHEELIQALGSTLIDGEQVLSPTAEAALDERIRQVVELGYTPGNDEETQRDLISAALAHGLAGLNPGTYDEVQPFVYPWTLWRRRTAEEHLTIAAALMAAAGDVEARR